MFSRMIWRLSIVCAALWIIVVGLSMYLIKAPWWTELAATAIPAFIIVLLGAALAWILQPEDY